MVDHKRNARKARKCLGQSLGDTFIAMSGLMAPLLFWLIFIIAGLLRPGYNPIRQYGSDLEVGLHGWLQRGNFIVVGLLLIILAYGLDQAIARGTRQHLGPSLIAIAGIALAAEGIFPTGIIHGRAFKIFSYTLIASFMVIVPGLRADRRWRAYSPYSMLAAIVALILWIAYLRGSLVISLHSQIGLVQRLYLAVVFGWLEVLAIRRVVLLLRPNGTNLMSIA